jgi:hypothetical protein
MEQQKLQLYKSFTVEGVEGLAKMRNEGSTSFGRKLFGRTTFGRPTRSKMRRVG